MAKKPVITAAEAALMVRDGMTISTSGFVASAMPEALTKALEERFLKTGSPRDLTLFYAAAQGNRDGSGADHFAHEGMLKRVIGGHYNMAPELGKLINDNKLEAYNLPQGTLAQLFRDIAGHKLGTLTHVGLNTFADPRIEGGKLNRITTEDLVEVVSILGQERLLYKAFDIDTVMFIHTAADPIVECTLVPDMALAVAEQFALARRRVLVLLTDMTNYADAQKEMAITMEQVPSNRGYPGDLYSCLAARYEKAVDFEGAGSITILGVTTMPGDDVTHPVPDNTGYITEGQYYLKNGHIEPFGSLSRLKQNVNDKTRNDHRALMDGMIRLYSAYKESLEKKSMGFLMTEWDEKLLKYGHLFETKLMDLRVNIPLEEALDLGWEILAECFEPNETGLKTSLLQERWPKAD